METDLLDELHMLAIWKKFIEEKTKCSDNIRTIKISWDIFTRIANKYNVIFQQKHRSIAIRSILLLVTPLKFTCLRIMGFWYFFPCLSYNDPGACKLVWYLFIINTYYFYLLRLDLNSHLSNKLRQSASNYDGYQERITENKTIMEHTICYVNEQPRPKIIVEKLTKFDCAKGSFFLARLWN